MGLELRCFGRTGAGVVPEATTGDHDIGGPDQAGGVARCLQDGSYQIGRRGLAVGAGDTHDPEVVRWIAGAPGSGMTECRPGIGDHELGNFERWQLTFDDDGACAGCHGPRHMIVAIGVLATSGHEDIAGCDPPGVIADGTHAPVRAVPPRSRIREEQATTLQHVDQPRQASVSHRSGSLPPERRDRGHAAAEPATRRPGVRAGTPISPPGSPPGRMCHRIRRHARRSPA